MNRKPRIPLWAENIGTFILMVACMAAFSAFMIYRFGSESRPAKPQSASLQPASAPDPFIGLNLEAKAAYVVDATTGQKVFGKDENLQLPLASLTKLMTALVAYESVPDFTTITLSASTTDSYGRLQAGERWKLKDLLDYTLVASSNYGAESIANVVGAAKSGKGTVDPFAGWGAFIRSMNETAFRLGLRETYFLNPSGLDSNSQISGAYGSARDMATLVSYIIKRYPSLLAATAFPSIDRSSLDKERVEARNTNIIAETIPGLLASKTGFTDLAGGNLAVAFDVSVNEPYVVVVLGSSEEGRFTDVQKLIQATIEYLGTRISAKGIQ